MEAFWNFGSFEDDAIAPLPAPERQRIGRVSAIAAPLPEVERVPPRESGGPGDDPMRRQRQRTPPQMRKRRSVHLSFLCSPGVKGQDHRRLCPTNRASE